MARWQTRGVDDAQRYIYMSIEMQKERLQIRELRLVLFYFLRGQYEVLN